jgi:hypothetical protein
MSRRCRCIRISLGLSCPVEGAGGPDPHRIGSVPTGAPVVLCDGALRMGRQPLGDGDITRPCQSQHCAIDHHDSRHCLLSTT